MAFQLYSNLLTVDIQFEFGERVLDAAQFLDESLDRTPDLLRRNPAVAKLDQRTQGHQLAEPINGCWSDQFLLLPALELFLGNVQQTPGRLACERLTHRRMCHARILTGLV